MWQNRRNYWQIVGGLAHPNHTDPNMVTHATGPTTFSTVYDRCAFVHDRTQTGSPILRECFLSQFLLSLAVLEPNESSGFAQFLCVFSQKTTVISDSKSFKKQSLR